MEILEAFDAMGVAHSAASLCEADPKTVRRYAQARDLGRPVDAPVSRPKLIDPFLDKIEEWVDPSEGKVRADVAHDRLVAMGSPGRSGPRGGRRRRRPGGGRGTAGRTGRGSSSLACGCNGTGVRARRSRGRTGRRGGRYCSVRGWPGHGSGWCCRCGTGRCRP